MAKRKKIPILPKTPSRVCLNCGKPLSGDNLKCYECNQDDFSGEEDEVEFNPCSLCDGHAACEDFGCAFESGLGEKW